MLRAFNKYLFNFKYLIEFSVLNVKKMRQENENNNVGHHLEVQYPHQNPMSIQCARLQTNISRTALKRAFPMHDLSGFSPLFNFNQG